jgi:hypothetical protein
MREIVDEVPPLAYIEAIRRVVHELIGRLLTLGLTPRPASKHVRSLYLLRLDEGPR